jgi:DNA-binding MarR family transcriptional regulator
VSLTEAGHELVEATVDQVLSREASLVDGLDTEQQRQLVGLLELLLVSTSQRL